MSIMDINLIYSLIFFGGSILDNIFVQYADGTEESIDANESSIETNSLILRYGYLSKVTQIIPYSNVKHITITKE